ncbi:MAG: hypothetical protein LBG80_10460 [Bacteroidales bacterium]|nr:hypothetical protein [Bacteroidales bacterium]
MLKFAAKKQDIKQKTVIEFIDREITSWGGISILKKMIDLSGFAGYLDTLPLPEQMSNRGYPPRQLFLLFMRGIWCGAELFAHMDITRIDTSLQRLYGWERMPEHKAFERYFRKFDIPTTHAVLPVTWIPFPYRSRCPIGVILHNSCFCCL